MIDIKRRYGRKNEIMRKVLYVDIVSMLILPEPFITSGYGIYVCLNEALQV